MRRSNEQETEVPTFVSVHDADGGDRSETNTASGSPPKELRSSVLSALHLEKNIDDDKPRKSEEGKVDRARHMASTVALCLCTLTHSYLLISVFPYSGFMAIDLIPGVNEENAGSYAGLIASSFMIGRALSSYRWGEFADMYGRKAVLIVSLLLSGLWSILFGLAPTFRVAMVMRFLLGLSNGIVGTAKTAVSELARGDEMLETRGMGLVLGMWGWGFLISPSISGALAEPVRQYPNNPFVEHFEPVLSNFPFLLPNLVSVLFCALATVGVAVLVEETLPEKKRRSPTLIVHDFSAWLCSLCAVTPHWKQLAISDGEVLPLCSPDTSADGSPGDDRDGVEDIKTLQMRHSESCSMLSTQVSETPIPTRQSQISRLSFRSVDTGPGAKRFSARSTTSDGSAGMASLWKRKSTRNHLLVYWVYSFVAICVDEAFPLFCISKEAGLGLSEASIGQILAGSGLVFACCQYFVLATVVNRYGLYPSLAIGSFFSAPLVMFIPLSIALNNGQGDGHMSWTTYTFLCSIMAAYRVFGSMYFSSITIATNRTVPASQRARMNGMSMLGGSVAKGLGPAFAGLLVAFSVSSGVFSPRVGSVVVFTVIGALGLLVSIASLIILKEEAGCDVESVSAEMGSTSISKP